MGRLSHAALAFFLASAGLFTSLPSLGAQSTTKPAVRGEAFAKAEALAQKIHDQAAAGDFTLMRTSIDDVKLIDKALANVDAPAGLKQGALRQSMAKSFAGSLEEKVKAGASYRLLRVHQKEAETRMLFRYNGEDGINYHDMVVADSPAGLRVVDIYVFATGELVSHTLRRAFLPVVFEMSKQKAAGAAAAEGDYIKNLPKIQQFTQLARAGKAKEALQLYEGFPPTIKKDLTVMIVRVMATSSSKDEAQYIRAIDDFKRTHPDSPALSLLSIDGFLLTNKFDEAMAAVDTLEKQVGGDPYLSTVRCGIALKQNRPDKAKAILDKAIKADPSMPDLYYSRIELSLNEKDFPKVASLLTASTRDAGVTWSDLTKEELFAEFVKSPAYAKWAKETPKN